MKSKRVFCVAHVFLWDLIRVTWTCVPYMSLVDGRMWALRPLNKIDTVDGKQKSGDHHLGRKEPCKQWDKLPTPTGLWSPDFWLPSTVSFKYTPVNEHSNGKWSIWRCISYWKWFLLCMHTRFLLTKGCILLGMILTEESALKMGIFLPS